jgi:hypothetical protein
MTCSRSIPDSGPKVTLRHMAMSDGVAAGDSTSQEPDTYPVWTVRYIWCVTGADDRPKCTYERAGSESEAVDRAVFALDHYQSAGANVLVCAHIKRRDGWSEVPPSSTRLARHEYIYAAFQRTPARPS